MNTNVIFPLSKEVMKEKTPSIFTSTPHPKASSYYTHISTEALIDDMKLLGWEPVKTFQVKTKKDGNYQKHTIVFRNPNIFIEGQDNDNVWPEIILINSHDCSSCFEFKVGLFRLVCENGLIVSDKIFENIKIEHIGYDFETLRNKINYIIEKLPLAIDSMNKMKEIELNEKQIIDLAKQMIYIRFDNKKVNVDWEEFIIPVRKEDEKLDLWTQFNKFQEKVVNGNFSYINERGKVRKSRQIKSHIKDISLNNKLFDVALEFVN